MDKKMYGVIYMATNKINNKVYIGQTKRPLYERMQKHFFSINDGTYFHNAIKKYGIESFRWEVLQIAYDRDELNKMESLEIKKHNSMNVDIGYNLTSGGDSCIVSDIVRKKASERMKGHKPSKETIQRLSESHKGKPGYWKGKKLPQHVVELIRERSKEQYKKNPMKLSAKGRAAWNKGHTGYKNKPCTEEKRIKERNAAYKQWEGKTRNVICIETGRVFPSVYRVETELGLKVWNACKNGGKSGGFHWRYVSE